PRRGASVGRRSWESGCRSCRCLTEAGLRGAGGRLNEYSKHPSPSRAIAAVGQLPTRRARRPFRSALDGSAVSCALRTELAPGEWPLVRLADPSRWLGDYGTHPERATATEMNT